MRILFALVALALLSPPAFAGEVLDRVRHNDIVRCAAPPEVPGFAMPEGKTGYNGFDVEFCRAVAAAVLGDATKMQFFALPPGPRIAGLKDGSLDVLARDTVSSLARAFDPDLLTVGDSFYTGIGFLVRSQTNIRSIEALDGANFCLRRDPEIGWLLSTQMNNRGFVFRVSEFDRQAEAIRAFFTNKCDALVGNVPDLAAARSRTDNPAYYRITGSLLTLESFGPVVLRSDAQWSEIVHWTLQALIAAEGLNVSQQNLKDAVTRRDRAVRRLLGRDGNPWEKLGLPADWVEKTVAAVGNYGEIFERHLGTSTPMGLSRWPNDIWFRGGVLTAPAFQ
jgi:general L-amino acid transport system substrate-binding protein